MKIFSRDNKKSYECKKEILTRIIAINMIITSLFCYIPTNSFAADADDEKTQAFVSAYKEAYGDTPNQFAADTYDVLYAMKAAADAAEITPDMSNEDISAAMSEAMLSVELDGLTGKAKWTEDGECDKEPKAFEIQDGAYVEME